MNNYISRENAIGLKEIGYAEPTVSRYKDGINGMYHDVPLDHNQHYGQYSAPDFLTAADWLAATHDLQLMFSSTETVVINFNGNFAKFDGPDHRNSAMKHAILIVKERRE